MPTSKNLGASSLGHYPSGHWKFDETVASVFSDMLERSIPQYRVMRKCTLDLGLRLTPQGSTIVDLGCSTGDGLAQFVDALGTRNRYLGVDTSEPMLDVARQRFKKEIQDGLVEISQLDLRDGYPNIEAGLVLCILTLQFLPVKQRRKLLAQIFAHTMPNGAVIVVEKVVGDTTRIDSHMTDLYHALKRSAGYTAEEVERKRLSLEGILVPVTARQNEDYLREVGFNQVDCFWRWMNFAGWVATK